MKERIKEHKIVSIADNAYANGGDIMFIHLLDKNQLLMQVGGYAGWNTSANTIGTAIAEAVDMLYNGKVNNMTISLWSAIWRMAVTAVS